MLYENLEIAPSELPDVLATEFNAHPKRYLKFRFISMAIVFLLIATGLVITWMSGNSTVAIIVTSIWAVFLLLFIIFEINAFPRRGYLVRERDVSYRSGLIFRDVVTVPFNRIQHSEVSHGPIARMMNLATLKIYTAGGSSSDLSIHGLDPSEAEKIKDWITTKTSKHV